jgi:hypothetical protein
VHLLTGEAVPIAPFALDAVLGIATLGMVLVFIVCLGLREGWDHTLGYGLRWLANQLEGFGKFSVLSVTIDVFGPLADVFRSVDRQISHALAVAALNTENAAASLWHMTGRLFWWTVHETKALSVATYHALFHTVTVTVPDAAKWARREAVAVAHRLTHIEAAARRTADAEIRHVAHVAEADALHGIRTAEHALDWSETQVGHLGREIDALKGKLGTLAHRLAPAALVALIGATIFKDFGLGWLRCGNVGNVGRRLCGLGTDLIDALLLGTLAVEGSISLVSAAHELIALADEIVPAVTGFVSELGAIEHRTAAAQGFE